jgi:peptidoglycan biosynthesis protein MviN/MurJ (putative lipid II flippase)
MLAFDRPILTPRRIRRVPWALVATVLASGLALVAIGNLMSNWLDVYLVFFGEQPQVMPSNVAAYRVWGTIIVLALVAGVLSHVLNRRRRVLGTVWQALLLLGGAAILVLCYIPGAVDLPEPEREPDGYRAPPCYSGGDNDECVGG